MREDCHIEPSASGRRLHGSVVHLLGRAILRGDHAPGDTLPSEYCYSAKLGVSRASYREAVKVLIGKGLVESRTQSGTRVLPRHNWSLLDRDVLAWAQCAPPNYELLRSLLELRAVVGPMSAALAAERRDRADLAEMNDALRVMRAETLFRENGRAAERGFHMAILKASRNETFVALGPAIGLLMSWSLQASTSGARLCESMLPDYRSVYKAVCRGDADDARMEMSNLIEASTGKVISCLEG